MYGSLQCRNVIDNLAYTITEVKNYLYSPAYVGFCLWQQFFLGGMVFSWLSVSSKIKWGIWEVFVLSVIDIHNEIISTRNLLWCTLLDVFWENNLVLIKSICCFDIFSWKFSAPLRVYSAFCTSEWEILKLTFSLENDSSDVSEKTELENNTSLRIFLCFKVIFMTIIGGLWVFDTNWVFCSQGLIFNSLF